MKQIFVKTFFFMCTLCIAHAAFSARPLNRNAYSVHPMQNTNNTQQEILVKKMDIIIPGLRQTSMLWPVFSTYSNQTPINPLCDTGPNAQFQINTAIISTGNTGHLQASAGSDLSGGVCNLLALHTEGTVQPLNSNSVGYTVKAAFRNNLVLGTESKTKWWWFWRVNHVVVQSQDGDCAMPSSIPVEVSIYCRTKSITAKQS